MAQAYAIRGWSDTEELGVGTVSRGTYCVTCDWADFLSMLDAKEWAKYKAGVPQYNEPLHSGIDMYCYSRTTTLREDEALNQWIFSIACEFRPGHLVGKNYVAYFFPCMDSRQTCHDYLGGLLQVGYTFPGASAPMYQAGQVDVLYPGGEVRCIGTSETSDPVGFQGDWQGFQNSDRFLGFPPGSLVCMGATPEPISLVSTPHKYRFTFTFKVRLPLPGSGIPDGWGEALIFRNAAGDPMPDATWGNGLAHATIYPPKAFNAAPFF